MRCLSACDEKLTSISVSTSIGHGKETTLGMLQLKVFIGKLVAINTLATSSISISEIASLYHKIFNNTMEDRSLVMQRFPRFSIALFSSAQCSKVLSSFRRNIRIQLHHNPTEIIIALLHIEEHMRIVALSIGYQRSFLVVVHADLPKDPSELRLLLLFSLHIFHLELLDGLAYIFDL